MFVSCRNVCFQHSPFAKISHVDALGLHLQNCSFTGLSFHVGDLLYLHVEDCVFISEETVLERSTFPQLNLEGLKLYKGVIAHFSSLFNINIDRPTVVINNSHFTSSVSGNSGAAILATELRLVISNCVFMLPRFVSVPVGQAYIYSSSILFEATSITMDAGKIKQPLQLLQSRFMGRYLWMREIYSWINNISVVCAPMFKPTVIYKVIPCVV